MSKRLWARIGMSCEVSDIEYEQLQYLMKEKPLDAAIMLHELFNKKGEIDGDCYLPYDCADNPNIDDNFDFECFE